MLDNANIIIADFASQPFQSQLGENLSSDKLAALYDRFSESDVNDALSTVLGGSVADLTRAMINDSDLPDFIKDIAGDAVSSAVGGVATAGAEAQEATRDVFQEIVDSVLEQLGEDINENIEESEGGSEGSGGGSGTGSGNWLAVLAKAMGDVAGKHLGNSVRLSEEIGALSNGSVDVQKQAELMPGLQAEMQAETQMFKLAQEAAATIVKSVGEALSSTARKQ